MINEAMAARFRAVFGEDLADYWDNLTGFNIIKFDAVLCPGDRSVEEVIREKYGQDGFDVILDVITEDIRLAELQCRYCGGDCPTNENNCCDGYSGDIDSLYSPTTQEPDSQ